MSPEQQSVNAPSAQGTDIPSTLPLITVHGQVLFPMSVAPIKLSREGELKLVNDAVIGNKLVAVLTCKDSEEESADSSCSLKNAYEIGCVARILQLQRLPDGDTLIAVQALRRFRVQGLVQREPYPVVELELVDQTGPSSEELAPLVATLKQQMSKLIDLSPNVPDEAEAVIQEVEDAGFLADLVAANLSISTEEKQKLLAETDREERLKRLAYLLAREVELQEVSSKIQKDVKSSIDKSQREYFLRQQMKAIQDELGESGAERPELDEYRKTIEELGLKEPVKKEALRELDRVSKMNEASAEYHVLMTYLDWITELPWNQSTDDHLDIARAEQILDEDHYGLDKVKRRIVEYLAVRKLKPDAPGPILCFVGPPGVGKTSLGQSIARALGRSFVRMSLGGMRDEAEIRGHRKTYVGALPGRVIQNIRKAGSNNPVFMLDEVDKVGQDFRGDPSSALLEVLDPAQNDTFQDHYLNVPFDLSNVMFIATANMLDTIPWALRDRMEVIEIPGYTVEEKLNIARKYLVPRQLEAHGLTSKELSFTDAALRKVISDYTREAGVRNLEREIANVCRGCARKFAEGRKKKISIAKGGLKDYLGSPKVHHELAERTKMPGVATGLAYTPTGGVILFIEATRMPGKGVLTLTGQLGEVMKESAQAVMSYIRANADAMGMGDIDFSQCDIHIHVPAGAVPKDGPSAGVAILVAVVSLLKDRRVKNKLAMTGEISLRGQVLQVGGIKEKVLAASRAGIKEVILPDRCRDDLDEVPREVKDKLEFHLVSRMQEVLEIALGITF